MTANKRAQPSDSNVGMQAAQSMGWNDYCGGHKVVGPIIGALTPIGPMNTGKTFPPGTTLTVFNTDTVLRFIALGDAAQAAPTDASNGLPCPPGQYVTFALADYVKAISNSALVFGYSFADDTTRKL